MNSRRIEPLKFSEAQKRILNFAESPTLGLEYLPVAECIGRVLADDVFSDIDIPGADNSSMDGYCLKAESLSQASPQTPVTLPVFAGIDAGHKIEALPEGLCAYIATGGILPPGANTVVRIEDVKLSEDGLSATFFMPVPVENFVRKRASERKINDLVSGKGTFISSYVAGQIAGTGRVAVKVKKKPVVAVLTSGDEIIMPWEHPLPHQVRNSNSIMLCSQVNEAGAQAFDCGIARDTGDHARSLFLQAADMADIIVTSGGISMGRKDPFKKVFADLNIEPEVYGVQMKPGKPVFFGLYGNKPVFGLPGNQVSSAVTFELFVRPFIRKHLGLPPNRFSAMIPLTEESLNDSGRDFFKRGTLETVNEEIMVTPLKSQESHMLSSLAGAQVLFLHPEKPQALEKCSRVYCIFLQS